MLYFIASIVFPLGHIVPSLVDYLNNDTTQLGILPFFHFVGSDHDHIASRQKLRSYLPVMIKHLPERLFLENQRPQHKCFFKCV